MFEGNEYDLLFHPDLEEEVGEHYEYYENQVAGLGDRFFEELKNSYPLILEAPKVWPKRKGFHMYILPKFPFSIFYDVEYKYVVVYAVAHSSKEPFYWLDRPFHS